MRIFTQRAIARKRDHYDGHIRDFGPYIHYYYYYKQSTATTMIRYYYIIPVYSLLCCALYLSANIRI